jgi:rhamnose transport system permease protein
MSRYKRELSVGVAFGLLLIVLAVGAPSFFQLDNLRARLVINASLLVACVGMTLVILSRNIDISIGSQFSLCGVAAALLARAGVPMPVVVLAVVLFGSVLGAVNGALIAVRRLPSIVTTLATWVILREGLRWWREGESVPAPPGFQWFGLGQDAGQWVLIAVAVAVFALFAWGLGNLAAGRAIYATGSDPEAAWLVGIRPRRVVFGVFVTMGALTGLAAVLDNVRFAVVATNSGEDLAMQVIAAVVIGGVAVSGGRGSLVGPLLGLALLATVGPALDFLKVASHWNKAIQGGVILVAVSSESLSLRRRKHAGAALPSA